MDDNREFDFQELLKDTQTTGEDTLSSDIVIKPIEMVTGVINTLAKELGLTLKQVKELVSKIGSTDVSASPDLEPVDVASSEEDVGPAVDKKISRNKPAFKPSPKKEM